MIERTHSNKRMSQRVRYGTTVYLAGQVSDEGISDIRGQTKSVLSKIDSLLAEAKSSKENILSATIYLRDIKDFAAMNEIWDAWVSQGNTPARACVEARLAAPELLVEICIIAAA